MPAIDIGGNVYRTLSDPIYLEDGRQVKEVWIRPTDTGTPVKVYPEDAYPRDGFVCKGTVNNVRTYVDHSWSRDDGGSGVFGDVSFYLRHNYCFAVSGREVKGNLSGARVYYLNYIDLNVYTKMEEPWDSESFARAESNGYYYDETSKYIINTLSAGCAFHANFDFTSLTDEEMALDPSYTKAGYENTHRHLIHETAFEDYYYEYRRWLPEIAIFGNAVKRYNLGGANDMGFAYDVSLKCRFLRGSRDYLLHTGLSYQGEVCEYYSNQYTYKNWVYELDPTTYTYVFRRTEDPPTEAFHADTPSTDL